MITKSTNNSYIASFRLKKLLPVPYIIYICKMFREMEKKIKKICVGWLINEKGLYLQTKCN
jgi:hypothetical protein